MSTSPYGHDPIFESAGDGGSPTHIDDLCDQFARAWRRGEGPRIEDLLGSVPASARDELLPALLWEEFALRRRWGGNFSVEEYLSRFPDDLETVVKVFARTAEAADAASTSNAARSSEVATSDHLPATAAAVTASSELDRYRKIRILGKGTFGTVWLADDLELRRQVAIKEPRVEQLASAADVESYLAEARVLASLDHPHIVPVYDVGRTKEGWCFVVSKLIDGMDLATHAKQKPLTFDESAHLVATVAEALQHTHNRGLVHRDIKPANILIDSHGRPFVADFGLALREEDFGQQQGIAGTPAYMSPEQARGESHLVDGRSDVFSLGVVLYELLTGMRPFSGSDWDSILKQIATVEPQPPRQRNDAVPKELERICLKALSKRAADRYLCAMDFADDLRRWSAPSSAGVEPLSTARIVPKGLRSFDNGDRKFFLELLPGPRDRDGLPESILFWKHRIEETDPARTFRVGLVYGPSGCGKSSLMKAGILPRLADHVIPIFLEAVPDSTEQLLLAALRRACPDLPRDATLTDSLAAVRRGKCIPAGRKILLVLDQFEQWLHSRGAAPDLGLAEALRQCDGRRIQAVLLVRDDFWMPISEFMRSLEIRILEGENAGAVSLFDCLHARRVLAEFGKAYGRLSENLGQLSPSEESFLNQAVSGLAQDGKVICVRLSLLADMMKGRPWTPNTLREVGGISGIGTTFLEETFSSQTAPPQHQLHQKAARAVLRALLPTSGTNIKGHMRSHVELLEASGYANRPLDFAELMRILDSDVRLITPVTGEGQESAYQLTHDYLVPSLHDWLTHKQRETRRGRAELRLEERAATWYAKPQNRYLPSLWEYLNIRALTDARHWTDGQRSMMAQAARLHGLCSALGALAFVALVAIVLVVRSNVARQQEATRIQGLVGRLVSAEPNQLSVIIKELDSNPAIAATYLSPFLSQPDATADAKRAQLHARLATVARDPSLVKPLVEELLTGKVTYVIPIRQQLRPSAAALTDRFRDVLRDKNADARRRFRAALALADYVPESDSTSWTEQDLKFVAEQLVSENAEFQPLLRDALRPIHEKLLSNLERIFGEATTTDAQRLSAANAFADYSASDIPRLTLLLTLATPEQFAVLYPLIVAGPTPGAIDDLVSIAATLPPDELGSVERIAFGKRRANAAVTLLRLGERDRVLPVFDWTDDPEALTQFIFRCRPRGVDIELLLDCLQRVSEAPSDRYPKDTRYALLLALGEFSLQQVPESRREAILRQLADLYRNDRSSGVHGASGWLLRQWGETEIVREVDHTHAPYSPDREWFTLAIDVTVKSNSLLERLFGLVAKKRFFYTFVVFPAGEYEIGSVADEVGRAKRESKEQRHRVILTRPYALLDREITFEEVVAFEPMYFAYLHQDKAQPTDVAIGIDWYDSVKLCRWLGQQSGLQESEQAYAAPDLLEMAAHPRDPDPSANLAPRNWPVELSRRGFRLPTEAEWQVACRTSARTAYGFGSDAVLLRQFGWFQANSGNHVHPPRQLRPSVRGVFDLHGNVYEWAHDWFEEFSPADAIDPLGPPGRSSRVMCGGSWGNVDHRCRTADRSASTPTERTGGSGLRLALSLSGASSP